ncbi:MAG: dipeptide ABC transporter ATP-binding protein [Chloroflexi bacterium]|nr:dipeptide ABC transporter ATP-binding protein [Chloroflexota bacterium]MYF79549.1 dipeptide ABC transporter ATP-binding protein [Chloroflexota bacterium]
MAVETTENGNGPSTLLDVRGLVKYFPIKRGFFRRTVGTVKAVDDISFDIREGETLSLVGESGCGKSTTARSIIRAYEPTAGEILFKTEDGEAIDLAQLSLVEMRPIRRQLQMIFQDPFSSLNPRMNIYEIISEPLLVHGIGSSSEREDRVAELLRVVRLRPEYMRRYPHAFSGGQRQRIGIARALALNPRLILADEPVSGLDVSVQAQVINLMMDLQDSLGLTYLFVSHDLSVVKQISNRVVVMYVGRIAEIGTPQELFDSPKHPYTAALMSSVPKPHPSQRTKRYVLEGEVANPANPPTGCYFHPRCPFATDQCKVEVPPLVKSKDGRYVSCHRADEIELTAN